MKNFRYLEALFISPGDLDRNDFLRKHAELTFFECFVSFFFARANFRLMKLSRSSEPESADTEEGQEEEEEQEKEGSRSATLVQCSGSNVSC